MDFKDEYTETELLAMMRKARLLLRWTSDQKKAMQFRRDLKNDIKRYQRWLDNLRKHGTMKP